MISSKLLLLFLEAVCRGHKPTFETLLFDGILRHDEFVVVEARHISGGRHIIPYLFFCRSLMRAGVSVLLRCILLEWVTFGTVRCIIIFGAGIFILAVAGFRAAPLTPALGLFLGGVILRYSFVVPILWDIHHVYVI